MKVRLKLKPDQERDVSEEEATDLRRMGLLVDGASAEDAAPNTKPPAPTFNITPSRTRGE